VTPNGVVGGYHLYECANTGYENFEHEDESTPDVIANVRQACLYEWVIRVMWGTLKLNCGGGDSGSKKFKLRDSGACGGVWRSLRLTGV
jgi:hypothetical protein